MTYPAAQGETAFEHKEHKGVGVLLWGAFRDVLGSPGRMVGFVVVAVVIAFVYTILLPFSYTQRVEFANWDYLSAGLLIWSILLGLGMSLVLSVQVYAMRRIAAGRTAAGSLSGFALVASLLPSFLCCTPIIPTVLAFVGVTGMSLYDTTGTLQHVFAVYQTEFLAGSLILLALSSWWGLHRLATAACLSDVGCVLPANLATLASLVVSTCMRAAAASRPGIVAMGTLLR